MRGGPQEAGLRGMVPRGRASKDATPLDGSGNEERSSVC